MSSAKRTPVYLLVVALMACNPANPAEVIDDASTFPLRATWSAAAAPVGTATVSATLSIKQYEGFRMGSDMKITGAPNATYQWRIFRGNCTVNTAQVANTAPTGLVLFATLQSYPDIVVGASGTGNLLRTVAGSLDSLTSYSVRVRPSQTATNWNGTNPTACGNLQRAAAP